MALVLAVSPALPSRGVLFYNRHQKRWVLLLALHSSIIGWLSNGVGFEGTRPPEGADLDALDDIRVRH